MEWEHFTERVNGVNIHFVAEGEADRGMYRYCGLGREMAFQAPFRC